MRLRNTLFLLSAATAAPLVAFALIAATFVFNRENDNIINASVARNRATLDAVDAELRGTIAVLAALTQSARVHEADLAAFHAEARALLATQPNWQNIVVLDAKGRQLLNARLPWGTPLPQQPVEALSVGAAVESARPAVGNLSFAPRLGNEAGVAVRYPVVREGRVVEVLTAVVSPAVFQKILVNQNLPAEWVSGIVGTDGRLIARVPSLPAGTPASRDYLDHIRQGRQGWYRGKTIEGYDSFTSFAKSDLTGWSIGFAMPAESILGHARYAAGLMAAGIALSLASAAMIGLWLSRRIARPISALSEAAALFGTGVRPPRVASSVTEVSRLSDTIDAAALALERRDAALIKTGEELLEQAKELRLADANKTRFLALLSHELRNPVAPLRNGLSILKLLPGTERSGETVAMMERQVAQLTRLLDDLLDVGRIDRGQIELRRGTVAVADVVRSAVEATAPLLEAKRQALVIQPAALPLFVDGDAARLAQVVSNLLTNASRYTPDNGRIELATLGQGDELLLTVTDTGIGFAADEAERIFDMFVRLDASRASAAGGLGIGLTITRALVEMHGGRITARSKGPGRGAEFTVSLPLWRQADHAPTVAAPVFRADPSPRRLLVADDNRDAADTMAEMLTLQGFEVRVAYDGNEAIEVARTFRPQVLFLDMDMPGRSGTDVARALGAEPWAQGAVLVAVTGLGQPADLRATQAVGFDAHLTKPVDPATILRIANGEAVTWPGVAQLN